MMGTQTPIVPGGTGHGPHGTLRARVVSFVDDDAAGAADVLRRRHRPRRCTAAAATRVAWLRIRRARGGHQQLARGAATPAQPQLRYAPLRVCVIRRVGVACRQVGLFLYLSRRQVCVSARPQGGLCVSTVLTRTTSHKAHGTHHTDCSYPSA